MPCCGHWIYFFFAKTHLILPKLIIVSFLSICIVSHVPFIYFSKFSNRSAKYFTVMFTNTAKHQMIYHFYAFIFICFLSPSSLQFSFMQSFGFSALLWTAFFLSLMSIYYPGTCSLLFWKSPLLNFFVARLFLFCWDSTINSLLRQHIKCNVVLLFTCMKILPS